MNQPINELSNSYKLYKKELKNTTKLNTFKNLSQTKANTKTKYIKTWVTILILLSAIPLYKYTSSLILAGVLATIVTSIARALISKNTDNTPKHHISNLRGYLIWHSIDTQFGEYQYLNSSFDNYISNELYAKLINSSPKEFKLWATNLGSTKQNLYILNPKSTEIHKQIEKLIPIYLNDILTNISIIHNKMIPQTESA